MVIFLSNAWCDHEIFLYWLNNIWFISSIYKSIKNSILILDRATTHFDNDLTNVFNKREASYVLIPPGLTSYLQPLDVGINKEIKNYMRRKDTEFRIKNNNLKAPNENDIICLFRDIWYNTLTYQSV